MLIGMLVVVYLFVGGSGAGALFVTCAWSLAFHRREDRTFVVTEAFEGLKRKGLFVGGARDVGSSVLPGGGGGWRPPGGGVGRFAPLGRLLPDRLLSLAVLHRGGGHALGRFLMVDLEGKGGACGRIRQGTLSSWLIWKVE